MRNRIDETGSNDGRTRLIDAAERLFADQGLDEPSARAIAAAAGHRNTAAVWYHFGDRDGLVHAVIRRRADALDDVRNGLLDHLEATGELDTAAAVHAIVGPWCDLLASPAGRRHLRVLSQIAHHPRYSSFATIGFADSTARAAAHLRHLVEHLTPDRRIHRARVITQTVTAALGLQAVLLDTTPLPDGVLDQETFVTDLVSVAIALGAAP